MIGESEQEDLENSVKLLQLLPSHLAVGQSLDLALPSRLVARVKHEFFSGNFRFRVASGVMAEQRWFYRTPDEWNTWVEQLKQMPCPHCRVVGRLNRHGTLVGYDERQRKSLRARRIYCSNRHAQRGCGRTFSVWRADKIRRLSLSTHVVWRFVRQVIADSLAAATRALAEHARCDRTWQRLWKRFQHAQSSLRTALLKRCPPPPLSSNRPEAQVLAHLQAAFPQADCPLAAFQHASHLFCL